MTTGIPGSDHITPEILLRAYASGLFPMAEHADDPTVFWVRPEQRGIIPLDHFHASRSLRKTIRQGHFQNYLDRDFHGVIEGCAETNSKRKQTWINQSIREAYTALFELGYCHTVEAWHQGSLVGGLYGITLGRAFFGESMFSKKRDASKVCLAYLIDHLIKQEFILLDTQFTTPHLQRFGAIEIPRKEYEQILEEALHGSASF